MLVRTLSNVVLLRVPGEGVWFTTMERGTYHVPDDPEEIYERLEPLATSRLVIDNEWIRPRAGALGWRRGHGGHRGGRASSRRPRPAPVAVPGRGVPLGARSKACHAALQRRRSLLREPLGAQGRDAVLDERERCRQVVARVRRKRHIDGEGLRRRTWRHRAERPPESSRGGVSVDAIEHWMIYQAHPDVGAILHVHAWMEGIAATDVNYPCGTQELAVAVADLVALEPDPAHAVIGLRNHGITCTGESLSEILDRVAPKVLRQVPMTWRDRAARPTRVSPRNTPPVTPSDEWASLERVSRFVGMIEWPPTGRRHQSRRGNVRSSH